MNRPGRDLTPLAALAVGVALLCLTPRITVRKTRRIIDAATGEFVVRTVRWGVLRSETRRPTAMLGKPEHRNLLQSTQERDLFGRQERGSGVDGPVVTSALFIARVFDHVELSAPLRLRLSDAYWTVADGAATRSTDDLERAAIDAMESQDESVLAAGLDRLGVP